MIYNNDQAILAEQSQLLTEGFTINKNPPDEFYKIAKDIVYKICKDVGAMPAENLFNKGRKMDEIKAFSRAADRAIQCIEFNKKYKKKTKFSISLPIYSLSLGEDSGSKALFDAIGKPIVNNGFQVMKESKKFLKKLFQTIYLYRTLSDKSFIVMTYSITYVTNYGVFAGWSTIKLSFKAVVNDEKALKALNIIESGNMEQLSEGLFDRLKKKKPDNNPIKNDKKSVQKQASVSKPTEKKAMFTDEQFDEIYEKAESIIGDHWNRLQNEIKKLVSKTNVAKAYKYRPDEGCEFLKDDIWGDVGFKFPCVFSSLIGFDIWNVEPNARTDYETSPTVKEVFNTNKEIIKLINQYSVKNNVKFHAIETGDWDTGSIDLFISIKDLDLSFSIPTNESTIFESVTLI